MFKIEIAKAVEAVFIQADVRFSGVIQLAIGQGDQGIGTAIAFTAIPVEVKQCPDYRFFVQVIIHPKAGIVAADRLFDEGSLVKGGLQGLIGVKKLPIDIKTGKVLWLGMGVIAKNIPLFFAEIGIGTGRRFAVKTLPKTQRQRAVEALALVFFKLDVDDACVACRVIPCGGLSNDFNGGNVGGRDTFEVGYQIRTGERGRFSINHHHYALFAFEVDGAFLIDHHTRCPLQYFQH